MPKHKAFSANQRAKIYLDADGKCQRCGVELDEHWEADHVVPNAVFGRTTLENAQALCWSCNRKKGRKA